MCHTIITNLECGHRLVGPVFRCDTAVATRPRGYPHDDGRIVICQPNEVHHIDQKSYCEGCLGELVRRLLVVACQPCRRNTVMRMGEAMLSTLPPNEEAIHPHNEEQQSPEMAVSDDDAETIYHW